MTTKTSERTALVRAADDARAQLAELREQAGAVTAQRNQRRDELRVLAAHSPEQFDGTGQPRKGTEAAALARRIEASEDHFPGLLEGAQQRVRAAEQAVASFTAEHAVELARELEAPAEAAVADIRAALAALDASCTAYVAATAEINTVVGAVLGLNGQDIRTDPLVDRLREIIREVGFADVAPPYSRSLTPKPGETPPRIVDQHGHYIPLDGATREQVERAGLGHLWRGKMEEAAV